MDLDICLCPYCGAKGYGEPQSQILVDTDCYCEVMHCLNCGKEYPHLYKLERVDTFEDPS